MKYVVFLLDGMADYPLEELGGKTPIEVAVKPNMDKMAKEASFATFLSLPDEFPTSSDVANMSVLGWDLAKGYTGRGAIESYGAGIEMKDDEVAFRMNLITEKNGLITDYSSGHISEEEAAELIKTLKKEFDSEEIRIEKGVSYRNLLYLKGDKFSSDIDYEKPDSSHGEEWEKILPKALNENAEYTKKILIDLMYKSKNILENHPINIRRREKGENEANLVWPWSGGKRPMIPSFYELYQKKGTVISAVDVILGLGILGKMKVLKPEGATGFIDTNYENKVLAAIDFLKENDFVYLHVEAPDECSHMGDLKNKIKSIEDADKRLIGFFLDEFKKVFGEKEGLRTMVLPDHPVPIKLRKHTRDKVPIMIWGQGVTPDANIKSYSEENCRKGKYLDLKGRELMDLLFSEVL